MKKRGSRQEHERIVADTLILLGREAHQVCRAFENPTGVAYRDEPWGRQWIRYGVIGSGDIYGFLHNGRLFYLEIKSGSAVQSPAQVKFQEICRRFNVYYWVVRSPEEALDLVLKAAANCN